MKVWHRGTVRDVVFGDQADGTLADAEAQVPPNFSDGSKAQLRARLKLVGSHPRVSAHILRNEGEQVYAVKTGAGVRGYGWFDRHDGRQAFIVNHFVFKDWQKMRAHDRARVVAAREAYRRRSQ